MYCYTRPILFPDLHHTHIILPSYFRHIALILPSYSPSYNDHTRTILKSYFHHTTGASWTAEYGSPDSEEEWRYLRQYSAYHNIHTNPHPDIHPPTAPGGAVDANTNQGAKRELAEGIDGGRVDGVDAKHREETEFIVDQQAAGEQFWKHSYPPLLMTTSTRFVTILLPYYYHTTISILTYSLSLSHIAPCNDMISTCSGQTIRDDRVHPYHARCFVKRLHEVLSLYCTVLYCSSIVLSQYCIVLSLYCTVLSLFFHCSVTVLPLYCTVLSLFCHCSVTVLSLYCTE